MQVPLSRGLFAVIDDDDAPLIAEHAWHVSVSRVTNYAIADDGSAMHRLILAVGAGELVDHIDGDGLNNRRSNLRVATRSQNVRNRRAQRRANMIGALAHMQFRLHQDMDAN